MAITLRHREVQGIRPDSAERILEAEWNQDHTLTGTPEVLLGTDASGDLTEITVGANLTLAGNTLEASAGGGGPGTGLTYVPVLIWPLQ